MASKKTPSELVVSSPEWQIPSREQLDEIEPGHGLNHVRKYHEGLRTIRIEVLNSDKQSEGQIQKFEMIVGDDGVPLLNPAHVAQLIRARGIRYATDEDRKTQFRVWLQGKSATTREWTQQFRFTVDPQITEDYQDADEGEDEDDEDSFDGPDVDEAGEESEEDEEEDEDQQRAPNGRDRVITTTAREAESPRFVPPRQQPQYAPETHAPLPPTHIAHPVAQIKQDLGLPVAKDDAHVQFNADFMLAMISAGEERVVNMIKPLMKEMRLGMQMVRRESGRLARESRLNARTIARSSVAQQAESSKRQTQLEDRLIAISELNYSHYENFQLIAQQGWTAFRNSMEKEAETYTRMREYDRALLGQQLTVAQNSDRSSAATSILAYAAPIGLAIGSSIMEKRGDKGTAKLMQSLAKLFAPQHGGDDDDEDDEDMDDEDVIDTEPAGPRAGPHQPPPGSDGPENQNGAGTPTNGSSGPRRPSSTPAISNTRELLHSLSEKQVKSLREILPTAAWEAIVAAANTEIEQSAIASMGILKGLIGNDTTLQLKVFAELNRKQQGILLTLIAIASGKAPPKSRKMPQRPQAAAG